jgi:hypothetical protein
MRLTARWAVDETVIDLQPLICMSGKYGSQVRFSPTTMCWYCRNGFRALCSNEGVNAGESTARANRANRRIQDGIVIDGT